MPAVKTLNPDEAQAILEGYPNELEGQAIALDAFYRQRRCPRCTGECRKETILGHAFSDKDLLVPRSCLRCLGCHLLFDPHSDLVLEQG